MNGYYQHLTRTGQLPPEAKQAMDQLIAALGGQAPFGTIPQLKYPVVQSVPTYQAPGAGLIPGAPIPSATPTWLPWALAGGAVLAVILLVRR